MKCTFYFVFLLLILFECRWSDCIAKSETDWQFIKSPPFKIHYLNSDSLSATELATIFQIAYFDLINKVEMGLTEKVHVFLAPSQRIFDELTGNSIPHWGEGVADPARSLIILKSLAMSEKRERIAKLVRHELTHVLIGQAVKRPNALPRWFNEGIAIYLSADEEFTAGEAISKALLTNSIVPLDEIDEVLKFHQTKAALAYEESYSFVLYLIEKHSFASIIHLVSGLADNNSFEEVFRQRLGADLFEEEFEWYEHIEEKYRWHFLVDFEVYLWVIILGTFLLVFIAVKLRNRRVLRHWEQEERLANPNR